MTLGRNRLLNRISERLMESTNRSHTADFKLMACGEMLASLREEMKQRREERTLDLAEAAA